MVCVCWVWSWELSQGEGCLSNSFVILTLWENYILWFNFLGMCANVCSLDHTFKKDLCWQIKSGGRNALYSFKTAYTNVIILIQSHPSHPLHPSQSHHITSYPRITVTISISLNHLGFSNSASHPPFRICSPRLWAELKPICGEGGWVWAGAGSCVWMVLLSSSGWGGWAFEIVDNEKVGGEEDDEDDAMLLCELRWCERAGFDFSFCFCGRSGVEIKFVSDAIASPTIAVFVIVFEWWHVTVVCAFIPGCCSTGICTVIFIVDTFCCCCWWCWSSAILPFLLSNMYRIPSKYGTNVTEWMFCGMTFLFLSVDTTLGLPFCNCMPIKCDRKKRISVVFWGKKGGSNGEFNVPFDFILLYILYVCWCNSLAISTPIRCREFFWIEKKKKN